MMNQQPTTTMQPIGYRLSWWFFPCRWYGPDDDDDENNDDDAADQIQTW
jgi:hypothetical protein